MSADPTAEHIDAVARVVDPFSSDRRKPSLQSRCAAEIILTSTNPRVHEALAANLPADVMLAALVRAGVLTEERAPIARHGGIHHWQQRWDGMHTHEGRRFVTPWQVAP